MTSSTDPVALLQTVENRIAYSTLTRVETVAMCTKARMLQAVKKTVEPAQLTYAAFAALAGYRHASSNFRYTSTRICLPMRKFAL